MKLLYTRTDNRRFHNKWFITYTDTDNGERDTLSFDSEDGLIFCIGKLHPYQIIKMWHIDKDGFEHDITIEK